MEKYFVIPGMMDDKSYSSGVSKQYETNIGKQLFPSLLNYMGSPDKQSDI